MIFFMLNMPMISTVANILMGYRPFGGLDPFYSLDSSLYKISLNATCISWNKYSISLNFNDLSFMHSKYVNKMTVIISTLISRKTNKN